MSTPPAPTVGTSDLGIASYLLATNRRLIGTEGPSPTGRIEFIFEATPGDLRAFFDPNVKVSPRLLLDAFRTLKAMTVRGGPR